MIAELIEAARQSVGGMGNDRHRLVTTNPLIQRRQIRVDQLLFQLELSAQHNVN